LAISKTKAWILMARPAFHSVGLVPFFAGQMLALYEGYAWNAWVGLLGAAAVFLIMLATYYLGEYYDFDSDSFNANRNPFSGGSGVLQAEAFFPRYYVLVAGYLAALTAVIIGFILYFVFNVGIWALILGAIGLFGGFFYSAKPFQLAYRGIGELFIGFCYGWLTINIGYYLLAAKFSLLATLISLPVALSITAVIIINEFPDRKADEAAGKRNMLVIFGPERMAKVYNLLLWATLLTFSLSFLAIKSFSWPWIINFILITFLILYATLEMQRGRYDSIKELQFIAAATIFINLLISLHYLFFFSLG